MNKITFNIAFGKYSAYFRDRGFGSQLPYISETYSKATGEGGYLLRDENDMHIAYITKNGKVEA
jgi:hypothetical protein